MFTETAGERHFEGDEAAKNCFSSYVDKILTTTMEIIKIIQYFFKSDST